MNDITEHSSLLNRTAQPQSQFPNQSKTLQEHGNNNNSLVTAVRNTKANSEQNKRIHHLKNACKERARAFYSDSIYFEPNFPIPHQKMFKRPDRSRKLPKEYLNEQNMHHESLYSDYSGTKGSIYIPLSKRYFCNIEYDFCICSVPKSGCTFWSQIFQVLGADTYTFDSIFNKPRALVHRPGFKYRVEFKDVVRSNMRTILIARDPYSRLYSAFIDKVYLPSHTLPSANGLPVEEGDMCNEKNVTFQDFLNFVIRTAKADKSFELMNQHWRPIAALCNPCLVNPFAVVKQETFSDDVEYSLEILEIESKKYVFLTEALHNRSDDIRIKELVKNFEFLPRIKGINKKHCFQSAEVAFRLWHAFQIQGYIDKTAVFPDQMKNSESGKIDWQKFLDLISRVREKYQMGPMRMREQRRNYLVDAYKVIDRHTIKALQTIYRKDFELYDYDPMPPGK